MTDTQVDLGIYRDKHVKFWYTPPRNSQDETPGEVEGIVQMVNMTAGAILLKMRGSVLLKLVEIAGIDFDRFEVIAEKPKELGQKTLPPVTLSSARFHLLDRHGWGLSTINNMSDEDALEIHTKQCGDHREDGHVHESRS